MSTPELLPPTISTDFTFVGFRYIVMQRMHDGPLVIHPVLLPRDFWDVRLLVVAVANDDGVVVIGRAALLRFVRHLPPIVGQRRDVEDSGAEGRLDTEFLSIC